MFFFLIFIPDENFTCEYLIQCLSMHCRLSIPLTIDDLISLFFFPLTNCL
ncbi:uncharacterized protein BX663DRAFT_436007 [Cokeromyces recurvatus]|nr:uncharacterized protein BX663DRAFT_436007 [Cokeromyces recurvatus]KAI7902271.1 hypothetical protein BX663DRAFT_436007 [Cokeromyces recurvatus]